MDANKTDSVAVLREKHIADLQFLRNDCGPDEPYAAALDAAIAALEAQGEVFGHYFRSADGHEHFTTGAKVPSYAQTNITPLYLHPAPPGSDAVTEAVPSDVMQHARHMVEGHYPRHREYQVADWLLRLAARTGKGEA